MSSVIFLVDHSGGKVAKASGELATFAKSIGESIAVVFASNPAEVISQLNNISVDKVITANRASSSIIYSSCRGVCS